MNTHICLGWTNCRLLTQYCYGYFSWCRLFTCRFGTWLCDRPYSWVACQAATHTIVDCGPGSIVANPGDILVDPEIYVRQIAELRADLQEAIRQLDVQRRRHERGLVPGNDVRGWLARWFLLNQPKWRTLE